MRRLLLAVALALPLAACASAGSGGDDGGGDDVPPPDAPDNPDDPDASDIDAPPTPIDAAIDAPPAPVAVTLSQSTNTSVITEGNSAACQNTTFGYTRENNYYRAFPLTAHGVTGQFTATRVDFGIELAAGGNQTIEVKLGTLSGTLEAGTITPLNGAGQPVVIIDQSLSLVQVTLTSPIVVPAGSTLVAEIHVPDGDATARTFFLGSNALGETPDPSSYVKAATCGINGPTTFDALGFSTMHMVLTVSGTTP